MPRELKVGTKVQILFSPLKKLCNKRCWPDLYKDAIKVRGKKRKLILTIIRVPPEGVHFEASHKSDGEYYEVSFSNSGRERINSSWNIPTSCFKVVEDK